MRTGAWGGSNCNSTSAGSRFTVVVTARSQLRCRALFSIATREMMMESDERT